MEAIAAALQCSIEFWKVPSSPNYPTVPLWYVTNIYTLRYTYSIILSYSLSRGWNLVSDWEPDIARVARICKGYTYVYCILSIGRIWTIIPQICFNHHDHQAVYIAHVAEGYCRLEVPITRVNLGIADILDIVISLGGCWVMMLFPWIKTNK